MDRTSIARTAWELMGAELVVGNGQLHTQEHQRGAGTTSSTLDMCECVMEQFEGPWKAWASAASAKLGALGATERALELAERGKLEDLEDALGLLNRAGRRLGRLRDAPWDKRHAVSELVDARRRVIERGRCLEDELVARMEGPRIIMSTDMWPSSGDNLWKLMSALWTVRDMGQGQVMVTPIGALRELEASGGTADWARTSSGDDVVVFEIAAVMISDGRNVASAMDSARRLR